jgi:hypothetical protein
VCVRARARIVDKIDIKLLENFPSPDCVSGSEIKADDGQACRLSKKQDR